VGLSINSVIVTTVQTIKAVSNRNRTLTGDYSVLVHSVLRAHSSIYCLFCSVVCWCSQRWHRSRTQYSTGSLIHSLHTMLFRGHHLPSLCSTLALRYT